MELFIIIVLLAIVAETTYLSVRTVRKEKMAVLAPVFVDTSVLIDGRIIAVAESGFITRPLYIPRSVVGELQFLADNADTEKRTRARHGLDVIKQLQSIATMKTLIFPDGEKAEEGVDNRLLSLAKKHKGSLCTIDYNLNKVAVVEGIQVLNVNELAKSLRMAYLPGERGYIELTQKGNDQHQAVGHLEDGTMVVVEHANKQIGHTVEVEFIRSLQTAAGKMMFAKLTQPQQSAQKKSAVKTTPVESKLQKQVKPRGTAPISQKAPRATTKRTPRQAEPSAERASQQDQSAAPVASTPQPKQRVQRQKQSRRPRSPEDSLMELVNRQD